MEVDDSLQNIHAHILYLKTMQKYYNLFDPNE